MNLQMPCKGFFICELMLTGSCLYANVKTHLLAPTGTLVSSDRNSCSYDAPLLVCIPVFENSTQTKYQNSPGLVIESCHLMSVRGDSFVTVFYHPVILAYFCHYRHPSATNGLLLLLVCIILMLLLECYSFCRHDTPTILTRTQIKSTTHVAAHLCPQTCKRHFLLIH